MTPPTPGLVTVGVPTYNRADLLRETLDGLLRQDHQALEIVVSDNHSTDHTPDVVEDFCRRDGRVRYLRQPHAVPVAENFRTPLREGTGEFFMWAADDDARVDSFVSTLVRVLRDHPETVLAAGEAQYRLPDGSLLSFFPEGAAWYAGTDDETPRSRLDRVIRHSYGNLIYGLFRRAALVDGSATVLDGWRSLNEVPVFLQVAARGEIRVVPQVLMQKTAALPVFLDAAREYGVVPVESGGAEPPEAGLRHMAGASRQVVVYHAAALGDSLRAVRSLPVSRLGRWRTSVRVVATMTGHCAATVGQVARARRPGVRSPAPSPTR